MGMGSRMVTMLLATGLAIASVVTAQAQTLPKIAEFYFDPDVAARPIEVLPAGQPDLVGQLMKLRERGRKGVEASVQLGSIAYAEGRAELGKKLYGEALGAVSGTSQQARGIRWNHAWDLYRQGDAAAALALWVEAAEANRGHADWVPPTLALVLWQLDRKDEAVQWFAAAVRTEPQQWADAAQFPRLLPLWRDAERAQLAQVQQAWAAAPPAWP